MKSIVAVLFALIIVASAQWHGSAGHGGIGHGGAGHGNWGNVGSAGTHGGAGLGSTGHSGAGWGGLHRVGRSLWGAPVVVGHGVGPVGHGIGHVGLAPVAVVGHQGNLGLGLHRWARSLGHPTVWGSGIGLAHTAVVPVRVGYGTLISNHGLIGGHNGLITSHRLIGSHLG